jgi:hypothetical protein
VKSGRSPGHGGRQPIPGGAINNNPLAFPVSIHIVPLIGTSLSDD